MDFDRQTSMVAAVLTAGLIIDTKLKVEDLNEAVRVYQGLGRTYMMRKMEGSKEPESENLELISAVLTAGYIVNTWHTEDVSEILDRMEQFRELYRSMEVLIPELPESKTFLNVAAAVIIAGLIINTYHWEETPEESMALYEKCMQKLAGA